MRTLQVSRSTARFIKLGHPWVRIDRFTKGLNALQCGETINLVDERGQQLASALADPDQDICARVYHRRPGKTFDIAQALNAAKKRRQALVDDPETNCYRLVHGESDFLPALRIEVLGDYFVILMRAPCIREHLSEILKWAHSSYPQLSIVIKEQFEDLRRHPLRIYDAEQKPVDANSECTGLERGVQVICRPNEDLATGVYVDQRATRDYLRERCENKRIANAFAYSGLFSSALLKANAASSVDIDIAAPALELATRNAALNGVSERHSIVVGDSIQFFKQSKDEFDIIILDPPTAAHGKGKQSWILRRDYPILLEAALSCLANDGMIVACRNTLGSKKQFGLRQHIQKAHPNLKLLENPSIGCDIPVIKGFPESKPYELVIAKNNA